LIHSIPQFLLDAAQHQFLNGPSFAYSFAFELKSGSGMSIVVRPTKFPDKVLTTDSRPYLWLMVRSVPGTQRNKKKPKA
jgi:hypothetical protein